MTAGWGVCASRAGGDGGDSLASEKGKLKVGSPGIQPSSMPSVCVT